MKFTIKKEIKNKRKQKNKINKITKTHARTIHQTYKVPKKTINQTFVVLEMDEDKMLEKVSLYVTTAVSPVAC